MTGIELWSTTAANNNSASPNGWPEGMPPSGVNDSARQMMAAVREWYETAEWINLGQTPTYIGATSFSITGDQTATYQIGRRIKAYGTTPFTIYGTITNSAYASVTTVTVTWDSGSLNSTLTTVWIGLASVTNKSVSFNSLSGTLAATAGGTGQSSFTVGDLLYASSTTALAKLAASTLNHKLYSGGAGVAPSWGAGFKVVSFTYDISTTGSQSVTGVGFKPSCIILFGGVAGTVKYMFGFSDGTTSISIAGNGGVTASTFDSNASFTYIVQSGGVLASASLTSMDTDGFTFSKSKVGSPTGSASMFALCIR